jgi:argininosuccinate lyase
MSTLYSGRFSVEPDAEVFGHGRSLPVDRRLVEDDITGSVAWAQGLARAGVLSADEARALVAGLEDVRQAVRANPSLIIDASDEDVH